MTLKSFLDTDIERISPFEGTDSVLGRLDKKKCLVVADKQGYRGLLTQRDLAMNYHTLAIDCLLEKPAVKESDEIDTVIDLMDTSGFRVLPVVSGTGEFLGALSYERLLAAFSSLMHHHVEVKNYIPERGERAAEIQLLQELLHHTKNPLQVILSTVSQLKQGNNSSYQKILLKTIEEEAEIVDEVLTQLLHEYVRNQEGR